MSRNIKSNGPFTQGILYLKKALNGLTSLIMHKFKSYIALYMLPNIIDAFFSVGYPSNILCLNETS